MNEVHHVLPGDLVSIIGSDLEGTVLRFVDGKFEVSLETGNVSNFNGCELKLLYCSPDGVCEDTWELCSGMIHSEADLKSLLEAKEIVESKIPQASRLKLDIATFVSNCTQDPHIFQEMIQMLEKARRTEKDPRLLLEIKICLADFYRLKKKHQKVRQLLKDCVENHYGQLPRIAVNLMEFYRNEKKLHKAFELLAKTNSALESLNYCPFDHNIYYCSAFDITREMSNTSECLFDRRPVAPFLINRAKFYVNKIDEGHAGKLMRLGRLAMMATDEVQALEYFNEAEGQLTRSRGSNENCLVAILMEKIYIYYRLGDKKRAETCIRRVERFMPVDTSLKDRVRKMKHAPRVDAALKRTPTKCSNPFCSKVEAKEKFQVCSKCKIAKYCSRECQRSHWKSHKIYCKKN